ncbi:unnamed protein product [Lactuca virosa]|uniref:Uncharacterized protein n=1 Tax=Lactuca virosa TaxID=75947 RepID=A0AAU9NU45_9ASTR|nr:unnamed protein product [Lactuca virosa]
MVGFHASQLTPSLLSSSSSRSIPVTSGIPAKEKLFPARGGQGSCGSRVFKFRSTLLRRRLVQYFRVRGLPSYPRY